MEEMVEITKVQYDRLMRSQDFLDCLGACGVDNWNGYSDAQEMFSEAEEV